MTAPTARPARLVEPFDLGDVELGEGSVFLRARDGMLHLARVYPVDRLLAVFRANAGLDTRGARPPGGWEEFGHPNEEAWGEHDYPGADSAQTANLLRGHYAGHFLSMLALAAVGERDEALRRKVGELVDGLAEVQSALAATGRFSHPGFLAAYGEWQFARLEEFAPYGEIWAPYYTCHKIMAGLLDAYELAGNERALEVATAMGRWVAHRLGRLDRAHLQRMWSLYIAGEYGGMNETLARLSVVADAPELLDTARLFEQDELLAAGSSGDDVLTGMHANQHLPQLVGYVHEYELTGERRYLDAAIGIWDQVVPGRMFAHGGTGESEIWGAPGTVAGNIGRRNAETCATYNLRKLARLLFLHTLEPRFMDYCERASLNHLLGSRRAAGSDTSPEVTYMFPVDPGALPEYDNTGTCCGGTGLENHVTHHDSVFFRAADGAPALWIAQLAPARLTWREQGVAVSVDAAYPWSDEARIEIEPQGEPVALTLNVRVPEWAAGEAAFSVNGSPVDARRAPGGFARVERVWHAGDVLRVVVPRALRAEPTIDEPALQSLSFGPSVLVARDDATTFRELPLPERRMLDGSIAADDESAAEALRREGSVLVCGLAFEPAWRGADARYHMYVRAAATTVSFGGAPTDVPARRREDGGTLLDDIWAEPRPATREAFLDRVAQRALAARRDGLVTSGELRRILEAASRAHGADDARVEIRDGAQDGIAWAERADERGRTLAWTVPADAGEGEAPPGVSIETAAPPHTSGWFTSPPVVRIDVASDEAPASVSVRVGEGAWRAYEGPFEVAGAGIVCVEARATGRSGLSGRASRELSIDASAPSVEARVRIMGDSAEIDLRARDEVSGVERIQWGGADTFWATYQEAFVRSLGDAPQVLEFSATDRAGNESARERIVLPPRQNARG